MSCAAYGCNNRTPGNRAKKVPGLSFHRFPKKVDLRAEWVKAVRRKNWEPSKYSYLCSDHFKESDFDRTPYVTLLKSNAVPSIFKAFPMDLLPKEPRASCNPVSVSSSPASEQGPSDETLALCIENVISTNEIVVDQNKLEATPPIGNYGKNDCHKNTVIIVSDTAEYKKVLNGHSDPNRRIVVTDQLQNWPATALPLIKNFGSINNEEVVKNKPEAAPTFSNYGENNCDKNTTVMLSDTADCKNVLNSHTTANNRIVTSDQLIQEIGPGRFLANTYELSDVPETYEQIYVNMYKNDPLLLFDDEFLGQRIKELEEIVKALRKTKTSELQKMRRAKRKLKNLRKAYIRYNKKNRPLLRCNSQPVVHFFAPDDQNEECL